MMPDWAATLLGIVIGVGGGFALGRCLYSWYYKRLGSL